MIFISNLFLASWFVKNMSFFFIRVLDLLDLLITLVKCIFTEPFLILLANFDINFFDFIIVFLDTLYLLLVIFVFYRSQLSLLI